MGMNATPMTDDADHCAVKRVAVIGAGVMGAGIAQWIASRGHAVILKDVSEEALAKGLATAKRVFDSAVKREVISAAEAEAGLNRITTACGEMPLTEVDLVIEAAVEKLELKRKIFSQLEESSGPQTILATNTSALSIDAIAEGLADPSRVVGIHFFNPVHRMSLVEIVCGARTSPKALEVATQFVKGIGKSPVAVKDRPGFLVNRILLPYLIEGVRLFDEGCEIARLDRVMKDFGMPMGPLRLCDEIGLDVVQHIAADLQNRLPHPVPINDTLEKMMAAGWFGKKSGCGFYVFGPSREVKEQPNPELKSWQGSDRAVDADDAMLVDRLILVMINEAARCLEEGVVASAEEVDFGMLHGTGWAPSRGGLLRYADTMGAAEIVRRMNRLTAETAAYFKPCERLVEMSRSEATFYTSS